MSLTAAIPLVLLGPLSTFAADSPTARVPSRVAQGAEVLQQNATRILTRETLVQRSLVPPGPRPRVRAVVSEFSFGPVRGSPSHDLLEYRQVLSVDGAPVQSADSGVRALSESARKGDDRARKRMLQEFARNGLVDIATGYSLILLEFITRGQQQMDISSSGRGYIGSDPALVFLWKQHSAEGGLTEFHGRESVHGALQGTLWVKLPLRVNAWMEIRGDASIDYAMSQHGFLTPASVIHHHMVNGSILTASSTISFGTPK